MPDEKIVETPVADLEIGMYVAELDRPWSTTGFLVQGFAFGVQTVFAQLCGFIRGFYPFRYQSPLHVFCMECGVGRNNRQDGVGEGRDEIAGFRRLYSLCEVQAALQLVGFEIDGVGETHGLAITKI